MRRPVARGLCGSATAGVIALAARRAGALGVGGAVAAWLVGTLVVAGGGWRAGGALVAFFASSSALSRPGRRRAAPSEQERGSERDAVQVWANGGVAAAAALGMAGRARHGWAAAYFGSVAAAAADTWATEVGRGARRAPRILMIGPEVGAGASGGMTPRGCAGAAAGAMLIACFAVLGSSDARDDRVLARFAAVWFGGVLGSLVDSVLGATVQEVRRCPICLRDTERATHCGAPTTHARGIPWLDNDRVNVAATVTGALAAWQFGRR